MKDRGYIFPVQILGPHEYRIFEDMHYHSRRYNKDVTIRAPFRYDGATGVIDEMSRAPAFHDWLTASGLDPSNPGRPFWDDGSPCTGWQSSMVYRDLLLLDGCWFKASVRPIPCWLWGVPPLVWVHR